MRRPGDVHTEINPNFTIRLDARSRPARVLHYQSRYEVRFARSTGKPGCLDVVLTRKVAFSGTGTRQPVTVVRAWRNRATQHGKPGSPFDLARAEAYTLRDSLDAWRATRDVR